MDTEKLREATELLRLASVNAKHACTCKDRCAVESAEHYASTAQSQSLRAARLLRESFTDKPGGAECSS